MDTDNPRDRVPIVLQLSALISGDTIYTRLFAVSHIPQLLHRVGRGHCRSSLCCISGNQSFRPPVDDGSSAIKTGVFLFACVRINTATASLAFACITGVLANFGKSYDAMSVKQWQFFDSNPGCRVCRHVYLYSRVFS